MVVGVTGHRNLRPDEIPHLRSEIRRFFLTLQKDFPELPITLLSPLAAGADQLVTSVAMDMGIRVIAILPIPAEMYLHDFDDEASLAEFQRQLAQSEHLEITLRSNGDDASKAGPARNLQYAHAGIFTSSHCHILLALWDGKENGYLGGTAQVVSFHLHGSMPGAIDRRQAAMGTLGLDEEALVYHIPAGRQNHPLENVDSGKWLTAGETSRYYDEMPPPFRIMFSRQAEYHHDLRQYKEQIIHDIHEVDPDCPIHRQFMVTDWLATTYRRRVSRVLMATYLIAAFMGYAFILYADIMAQDLIIYCFLLFFLIGIGLNSVAGRREWHRQYIDYRALAEGLRVQSYWRRAGIVDTSRPSFAHDNFLQKQDVELGWIRNVMRGASLEGMLIPSPAGPAEVKNVIREWIGDSQSPGQLAYYESTSNKRARHHRRNEWLANSCLWLGIGISALLAVFAQALEGQAQNLLVATMGVLSVTAAVHEAYAYKKADKELIKQYRYMARIFGAAKRRLQIGHSVEQQQQILRTLGEAALAEHAEWTLMHRERPLESSKI